MYLVGIYRTSHPSSVEDIAFPAAMEHPLTYKQYILEHKTSLNKYGKMK